MIFAKQVVREYEEGAERREREINVRCPKIEHEIVPIVVKFFARIEVSLNFVNSVKFVMVGYSFL